MSDLVVRDLSVAYGGIHAVRRISLEARKGQVVALVGPNGAGKSSIARAIMGLTPAAGEVIIAGRPLLGSPTHDRAGLGVGFVPEGRGIFAPLSVRENILLGGYTMSAGERERQLESVCRLFPKLGERLEQNASSLSGGEQQMLALARALMIKPTVLICDEPSMGLAPAIAKLVFGHLRAIADRGAAVLVGDQTASRLMAIADEVCVMRLGTILVRGSPAAIGRADLLAEHYFGAQAEAGTESASIGDMMR